MSFMITFGLAAPHSYVACMGIRVRSRHVKHASTVEGGGTVGGSSRAVSSARVGARPR